MTMPASPLATSSSARRAGAAGSDPVSRATRVPSSAPPSIPPAARSPSIARDRAVVLRGEHLGGRQQRGLAAGVDDARASPAARRPSCPSRPRPAAAGASGAARARSAASSAPTARCPAVSANGSRASKASSRPPGTGRARGGRRGRAASARRWASATCSTNASSKRSRCRARRQSCIGLRPVDQLQASRRRDQAVPRPGPPAGSGSGDLVEAVEHRCGRTRSTAQVSIFAAGGVDRDRRAESAPARPASSASPRSELVLGVGQLPACSR